MFTLKQLKDIETLLIIILQHDPNKYDDNANSAQLFRIYDTTEAILAKGKPKC